MARKIVITSGKGGVGKSTICLALGKQLAKNGAKVVLLDVDVGLHNLDILSGIFERVVFDVVDVIDGKVRVEQALLQDEKILDLYYLPSCHVENVGKVSPENLKEVLKDLSDFDYILLDCPAGIDFGFHRAVFCASEAIVVATPNISAINAADKVVSLLCNYELDGVGLVVNKINKNVSLSPEDIAEALKLPLVGKIFESKIITQNLGIVDNFEGDLRFLKSVQEFSNNIFLCNYRKIEKVTKRSFL